MPIWLLLKTVELLKLFVETVIQFFSIPQWAESLKENLEHLFKIEFNMYKCIYFYFWSIRCILDE